MLSQVSFSIEIFFFASIDTTRGFVIEYVIFSKENRMKNTYQVELLQWRKEQTGDSYESIAGRAGLSLSATWKIILGKTDPSASTLTKIFRAMDLDPKHALNRDLKKSQFRRAVVGAAR